MSAHIWMKHAETGNLAELPDLPYWRGAGWEPTDERPDEPDVLRDPPPEPTEAPAEKSPGLSAAKSKKSAAAEPAQSKEG